MKNTLIYLFGFAGTGKYTIAKEIARLEAVIVVDNHLINNPVFTVVEADGITPLHPGVWREIRKIREAVYNAICYLAKAETSFILTNELLEGMDGDKKLFEEVKAIAEARKALFLPVRLLCDADELSKRIVSEDRKQRCKEINVENLLRKLEQYEVYKPDYPQLMELDITTLTPAEAALKILKNVKNMDPGLRRDDGK